MQNGSGSQQKHFEEIMKSVVENIQARVMKVIDVDHPGFNKRMKEVEEETLPIITAIDNLLVERNWKATEVHFLYLIQALLAPLARYSEMTQKLRIETIEILHHYIKHLSHDPEDAERWEQRASLPTAAELQEKDESVQ